MAKEVLRDEQDAWLSPSGIIAVYHFTSAKKVIVHVVAEDGVPFILLLKTRQMREV